VKCHELFEEGIKHATVAKNMSIEGMCIFLNGFVSISHKLLLEFDIPNTDRPVKTIFQVKWMHRIPVGDYYVVGGKFIEMSDESRNLIADYVDNKVRSMNGALRKAIHS
jgi:hypothetical protein